MQLRKQKRKKKRKPKRKPRKSKRKKRNKRKKKRKKLQKKQSRKRLPPKKRNRKELPLNRRPNRQNKKELPLNRQPNSKLNNRFNSQQQQLMFWTQVQENSTILPVETFQRFLLKTIWLMRAHEMSWSIKATLPAVTVIHNIFRPCSGRGIFN